MLLFLKNTEGGDDMCPLSVRKMCFLLFSFENVIIFRCGQLYRFVQMTQGLYAISHIIASGRWYLHEFPYFASTDDADTVFNSLTKGSCCGK